VSNSAAQISNNTVNANVAGGTPEYSFISLDNSSAVISDNNISGYITSSVFIVNSGTPSIARNFINGNSIGMVIYGAASPVIENNTFAENAIGLNIYDSNGSPTPIIEYNNFEQNSQYNIYLGQQGVYGSKQVTLMLPIIGGERPIYPL
jgi:parallel beta-helix repeat protein